MDSRRSGASANRVYLRPAPGPCSAGVQALSTQDQRRGQATRALRGRERAEVSQRSFRPSRPIGSPLPFGPTVRGGRTMAFLFKLETTEGVPADPPMLDT